MFKKICWATFLFLSMTVIPVFSVSAVAAVPSIDDPTPNLDRIIRAGKIVVGTSSGYMPFQMTDVNDHYIGYNVDLWNRIGEDLGVEVEVKDMDFNSLIPSLQSGKVDIVLAGMGITGKRALAVSFSQPYYETGQCLLVSRKHEGEVANWKDLDREGFTIATSLGTTGDTLAQNLFAKAKVKSYPNIGQAFVSVLSNQADAFLFDQSIVVVLSLLKEDKVFPVLETLSREKLGIAVRHGESDLLQWLNSFIDAFEGTWEQEHMYRYWFVDRPWWDQIPQSTKENL